MAVNIVLCGLPEQLPGREPDEGRRVVLLEGRERLQDLVDDVEVLLPAANVGLRQQVPHHDLGAAHVVVLAVPGDPEGRGRGQQRAHAGDTIILVLLAQLNRNVDWNLKLKIIGKSKWVACATFFPGKCATPLLN